MATKPKIVMFNPQASPKMPYDGPPLSLLMAASMLDLNLYDVKVIDWHYPDFEERISSECAEAIIFGVTCMTGYQISRMLEAIGLARDSNPAIRVVCGGWHPTLLPEQTLKNEMIDFVVMGQGPRTFKSLVECVCSNQQPGYVKGVGYRQNGRFVINERPPVEDINSFPPPPYHLLEHYGDFLVETGYAKRAAYLLTSQGCPANCYFCSESAFHQRKWSARPVEQIMETVADLKRRYEIDGLVIADSNFFVSEKRTAEFCRSLKAIGLPWGGTSSRSDQLAMYSEETWRLMKESGLYDIFLGVESASDETLRVMNKGCTIADTLAVLPMAKKYGIRIQCSFVIGVPGVDVQKDFETDMKFINEMRKTGQVAQFHMFCFIPYPGTPFLEESIKLGYKQPETLDGWGKYDLHAHVTPWVPARYPGITDQLSVYFMFLAGNARKVVKAVTPRKLRWLALPAERMVRFLSDVRVSRSFYRFPVEYKFIKFILMHKHVFFGIKKLLF